MGVADPWQHFVVVADGGLNEDGRPVLVLAKKSPFTSAEYAAVAKHVGTNPNLVWLNPPPEYAGVQSLPPAAEAFRGLIDSNDPRKFARDYAFAAHEFPRLISIIHRDNAPSKRVAAKLGMSHVRNWQNHDQPVEIHAVDAPDSRAA